MTSKQMPLAYTFNVETPNQLVDIMTEEGRCLVHLVIEVNYNR